MTASEMYDLYIQAEADILAGKSVQMDGRTLTMEDLDKVRSGRREWARAVVEETMQASGYSTLNSVSDFSE